MTHKTIVDPKLTKLENEFVNAYLSLFGSSYTLEYFIDDNCSFVDFQELLDALPDLNKHQVSGLIGSLETKGVIESDTREIYDTSREQGENWHTEVNWTFCEEWLIDICNCDH